VPADGETDSTLQWAAGMFNGVRIVPEFTLFVLLGWLAGLSREELDTYSAEHASMFKLASVRKQLYQADRCVTFATSRSACYSKK